MKAGPPPHPTFSRPGRGKTYWNTKEIPSPLMGEGEGEGEVGIISQVQGEGRACDERLME
jgi:hypothetical protein